jgi:hypothetical protein
VNPQSLFESYNIGNHGKKIMCQPTTHIIHVQT